MNNTWTMQSMDTSGVGKAPDVEFAFSDDNCVMTAEPPGALIRIEAGADSEGFRSRVVLTNAMSGVVYADIDVRHRRLPDLPPQWEDSALYAGEIACSLYWSMWRMQQLKAQGSST